ncbi:hypothetical protein Lal_00021360 [Lupinus albus]|nr:hypothetical protein Lal_00021360 [Lupinus albus]
MEVVSLVVGQGSNSSVKKGVKAELQSMDVNCLVELIPKIPKEVQIQFNNEYGRLIDLLLISVDTEALKVMGAMVQYWSHSLRVFEFPNIDASPTVEEYEVLLDVQVPARTKVYLFTGLQNVTEDLIEKLIRVRPCPSSIIKQGQAYGLRWKFLKKHVIQMAEEGKWDLFKPAFALATYGMVLFPFVHDMVDQAAIDVFAKFRLFGANPVPAVLAETLLSLQRCHEKGHFKIRCCVQLLYVWMITKFKHHQYPDWSRHPLKRFRAIAVKPLPLTDWKKLFSEVNPRNFGTKTRLYERHPNIMYSCGEYPNMILMGPRGCISFTPALVLGQLKWGMMPVNLEHMLEILIWYKDDETTKDKLDSVRNALKKIRLLGPTELGEHQAFYTDEYKLWHAERRKGQVVPSIDLPKEPSGPSEAELLKGQLKVIEAKLEESRWKSEMDELKFEKLHENIATLKQEGVSLKRDYAQMCSQSDKYRLINSVKEKDVQLADLKDQMKARGRVLNTGIADKKGLEAKCEKLEALLQESHQNESQAWAQVKEYQLALDKAMHREDRLSILLSEAEKVHHDALVAANQKEEHLSREIWNLHKAYDEMIAKHEE